MESRITYSISINQRALSIIAPKIDIKEAVILYYISQLAESKSEKINNKKVEGYLWVDYGTLLKNMPLLKIKNKNTLVKKIKNLEEYQLIDSRLKTFNGKKFKFIKQTGLCIFILSQYGRDLDENIYNSLVNNVGMGKLQAVQMASSPSFWKIKKEPLKKLLEGSTEYLGYADTLYSRFGEWELENKNN